MLRLFGLFYASVSRKCDPKPAMTALEITVCPDEHLARPSHNVQKHRSLLCDVFA
jgi:hypothetical protein